MKQTKGGAVAPFVALGLLAVSTIGWGLWNRDLIPAMTPGSPTPSPLSTAPYYVRIHIGKHFDEDKNLVLEVPVLSDGQQHKVYEKKKGFRWLIDLKAQRLTNTDVSVNVQAKLVDKLHNEIPRQAMLRGGARGAIDAPPISRIDAKTGKQIPPELRWDVFVTSQPSQEAIPDSRYLY